MVRKGLDCATISDTAAAALDDHTHSHRHDEHHQHEHDSQDPPGEPYTQKTPDGYHNIERMLKRVLTGNGKVLPCGMCMDARGLDDAILMPGARLSTMDELAAATIEVNKCVMF